jgi:hypothetical protein
MEMFDVLMPKVKVRPISAVLAMVVDTTTAIIVIVLAKSAEEELLLVGSVEVTARWRNTSK